MYLYVFIEINNFENTFEIDIYTFEEEKKYVYKNMYHIF